MCVCLCVFVFCVCVCECVCVCAPDVSYTVTRRPNFTNEKELFLEGCFQFQE